MVALSSNVPSETVPNIAVGNSLGPQGNALLIIGDGDCLSPRAWVARAATGRRAAARPATAYARRDAVGGSPLKTKRKFSFGW